jgi:MoxR-like ATPase
MSEATARPSSSTLSRASISGAIPGRLRALRDALLTGLVERDVAIRLALIAALAGEHLLMFGPPGTAKSLVARRLRLGFDDADYFERLLTRFSVPEELFGPLSIKGLEEDRYERLTASYLPTASIAFLDEIFKANSAILNSLLTLLNEREFDNGITREPTPLIAAIGASNELPEEGEELDALYDRFLLRLHVGPVSKSGFRSLLKLRGEAAVEIPEGLALRAGEIDGIRRATQEVEVPADVEELLCELRDWCTTREILVSDRRWRKVVKLLQVSALTNGRTRASIWDCWLLQHCLWDKPAQRQELYEWYAAKVGASAAMDPSRLTRIVLAWEGQLGRDRDSRSQARDDKGRPLFQGKEGKATPLSRDREPKKRDGVLLYLAPDGAQARGRYGRNKIEDRSNGGLGYKRAELDELYVHNEYGSLCEFRHWDKRDAYLRELSNRIMEEVDLSPLMEPTRHKAVYVADCLAQVERLQADVEAYQRRLEEHITSLEDDIRSHLWVTKDFVEPAASSLDGTRQEVQVLHQRIAKLRQGFEMLPSEDGRTQKHSAKRSRG